MNARDDGQQDLDFGASARADGYKAWHRQRRAAVQEDLSIPGRGIERAAATGCQGAGRRSENAPRSSPGW